MQFHVIPPPIGPKGAETRTAEVRKDGCNVCKVWKKSCSEIKPREKKKKTRGNPVQTVKSGLQIKSDRNL